MTPATQIQTHCQHCQLELTDVQQAKQAQFCCRGCESVYQLLNATGLSHYYALKDQWNNPQGQPANQPSKQMAFLDDPEVTQWETSARDEKVLNFYIGGVHCTACVWLLEKLPELVPGLLSFKLNLGTQIARVTLAPQGSFADVAHMIQQFGYTPEAIQSSQEADELRKRSEQKQLLRIGVAAFSAGNLMILSVALYSGLDGALATFFVWLSLFLAFPALSFSAWPFYTSAWAKLKQGHVSIDTPIALSLLAGIGSSLWAMWQGTEGIYFDTLTTLVFLLLLSRFLLHRVQQRILSQNTFLHFYQAPYIDLYRPDKLLFESAKPENLVVGDLIRVLPGERLPVDGTVEKGDSTLDESILTGESYPVKTRVGQQVWAGSENLSQPLYIRVTETMAKSKLAQMIQQSQAHLFEKSQFIQLTDRISRYFVSAILGLAALVWVAFLFTDLHEGSQRALALIIISCPCALALSLPLIFSSATHKALKQGILVRSSAAMERLWNVKHVCFDKTGTLTQGQFELRHHTELTPELKRAVVTLEAYSSHPIARALLRAFPEATPVPEAQVSPLTTGGLTGQWQGDTWEIKPLDAGQVTSMTRLALYKNAQWQAGFELGDAIRNDSLDTLTALRQKGYRCTLISGDQKSLCQYVGQALNFEEADIFACQTPQDKEQTLVQWEHTLMIGDGANDAIALAAADVGISIQSGITEHIEAADIHLLTQSVAVLPALLTHAKHTQKLILVALSVSLVYNVLGITAALLGWVSPLFAAVLMPLSSLTVTGIALIGGKTTWTS